MKIIYLQERKGKHPILWLIFLLILYFIFSGLKNIYRVITIKLYSPMTRALTESITDPIIISTNIIIIIKNSTKKEENNFYKTEYYYCIWLFNTINIFCTIIMAFCSCVYNDFVVLYCCGLEHNTYLEIAERSRNASEIDIYKGLMEEEDENSSEENINTELTIN